jgi:hypothetical protein
MGEAREVVERAMAGVNALGVGMEGARAMG